MAGDDVDLDGWLASLLGNERDVSLVAVGSFGRGDRAPHSDLDLVLLHRSRRDIGNVAERIWYPIWDRKLRLDHSVRTVKDAVIAAEGDRKVALGLLDARHVAGDVRLTDDLQKRVGALWRKRAKRWIPQLREAAEQRHRQFDEVAFLLEPELKEGRGGLRDIALLRSLAPITTVLGDLIGPLDAAYDVLCEVRVALHVRTGRSLDRLLLQEQDGVAAALGCDDADDLLGRVSGAARTVTFVWDECWRRLDGWLDPKRRGGPPDRPLGPGIALQSGEVHLHGPASSWLAAAAAAAEVRAPLARTTLQRLADEVPVAADHWPFGWRQSFVALLGTGHAAIPVLEAIDHHGLLVRLVPEWANVQAKPQRNAYHRFTVDRHLFEATANAASLTRDVARPDLLLLGALLHDIGKGFPGDHTDAGVEVVPGIAARMGLSPSDGDVLVAMVRHHLLLSETATRRDIDDPDTVAAVAAAVGDRDTLALLAALTEADSRATGPSAWSDWKARLLRTLVDRTAAVLAGHALPEPDVNALLPDGIDAGIHGNDGRCIVIAPDRRGLFAAVAGVLALHGLDVLAATAGSRSGDDHAVEVFDIAPATSRPADWDRIRADIDAALAGDLHLDERLAQRARSYGRRDAVPPTAPAVTIDNESSGRATILEVRAADEIGVLHAITSALADEDLDIRSARVSTLGLEVVDAFYVVDRDGRKLTDWRAAVAADAIVQKVEESTRNT